MSENTEARLMEMVAKSLQDLQEIKTGLALQTQMLQLHSTSDAENFRTLSEAVEDIKEKMDIVQLERATEKGADEALARSAKFSTVKWGAAIATGITAIAEAVRQLASK